MTSIYLGVKGVELQLVGALEGLGVDLLKGDPVKLTLKDVDLLNVVIRAPNVVALPRQRQLSVFCTLSRRYRQKSNRSWIAPLLLHSSQCCQIQGKVSTACARLQERVRSVTLCSSDSGI